MPEHAAAKRGGGIALVNLEATGAIVNVDLDKVAELNAGSATRAQRSSRATSRPPG